MNQHPNAVVGGAGGGAGLGTLLVWLLNKYADANIGPEQAAAIAGAVAAVVLYIGRRGIVGVVVELLHGQKK